MKLLSISLSISVMILSFSSCTNQKAESTLLTDKQSCSLEDCPSPPTKIDGSLSVESDQGVYQLNMDRSDVIEIGGKCSDLGIRANRILVQVYEGEDTSLPPYIDNEGSVNCINSTTPANNGQRCFWLTQGRGVIDSGLEYPQCFNGRFSFSVKVGRLLRTTDSGPGATLDEVANPRRKYMVRFKMRTTDGAISESAWNSTLIERGVQKPTFGLNALPFTDYKCDVQINAFKNLTNLTDVKYDIQVRAEFINGGNIPYTTPLNPLPIAYAEPIPATPLVHVTNYRLFNVVPGVSYKARIKAYDTKYSYALLPTPGVTPEESVFSEELECPTGLDLDRRPAMAQTGSDATSGPCSPSLKYCEYTASMPALDPLAAASITSSGEYEWMVIKGMATWSETYEPSVVLPFCGDALANYGTSAIEGCRTQPGTRPANYLSSTVFKFKPESYPKNTCPTPNSFNGTYGVSVRFIDGATGYKGKWATPIACKFSL